MERSNESTVTYNEGGGVRTIRGLVEENGLWIIVKRMDGTVKINKQNVIKIEEKTG